MGDAAIQRTFAGGEIAPALHARADQAKYITGLRTCKNFVILRSGGVANRPGLRLVEECKTNSIAVRLMRYVSEIAGDSLLIEVGVGYFRFYKAGGQVTLSSVADYDIGTAYVIGDIVTSGGVNYYAVADSEGESVADTDFWYAMPGDILEVPHPFGTSLCNYSQNGRVITLTSGAGVKPPYELIYVSLTHWVCRAVNTEPSIEPPATLASVAGAAGTRTLKYQVTAGAEESYEESVAGGTSTLEDAADPTVQAPHALSWDAVDGAAEYYIYCDPYGNGTFGFIGTATGQTTFNDVGFVPDFTVTPPQPRTPFADVGGYPRQAATYQQRRFFANTVDNPDAVFGSRIGFTSNFNVSSPLQDDDAVTFRIAGNQHNPVRHMVGLKALIVLTDAGVWAVTGGGNGAPITPSQLNADQETYVGVSADIAPVVVGNAIIYVQARGAIVCDLRFDQQVEGFAGRDLTLFATHLFDGYTVVDMDFQQTPNSTVWLTRSDGTLLGLTYLRDQDIWGWHRHTTGASGLIEHVCVVPENNEDVLYVIVRRTIGGAYHRFIERLEERNILDFDVDSFFVDSGLSYVGPPVYQFDGLDHLEGEQVACLADGQVIANGHEASTASNYLVVSGGRVTLPAVSGLAGYSVVHIGLPITYAEIETLDLDVQGSTLRDKRKKVSSVALLLDASSRDFLVGPDADHLLPYNLTPYEGTSSPWTGRAEQSIVSTYNEQGRILVRQVDPVPLTVLAAMPNVEVGG
jgi:hypothetical protein